MNSGQGPEVKYTFKKSEKLCYRRSFDILFQDRKSVRAGRLRIFYAFDLPPALVTAPLMVAYAVPKRNFKKAVTRNLLKRRLREATRLHKHSLIQDLDAAGRNLAILIRFSDRTPAPYYKIERDLVRAFQQLQGQL